MALKLIATACGNNSCPTIYLDEDQDTLVVQGYRSAGHEQSLDLPAEEGLVTIPRSLLAAAWRQLG